jgi:hypothetical protein
MSALLKSRLGLYGVVALFVVGITMLAIVSYRVYNQVWADTPDKAVRTYMNTLNKGDMMKLYDLSRGASSQTQAEFAASIGALVTDKHISFQEAAIESIGQSGGVHYYRVTGKAPTTDGSYRLLPLILESAQEGGVWRVGMYLPPAGLVSGQ